MLFARWNGVILTRGAGEHKRFVFFSQEVSDGIRQIPLESVQSVVGKHSIAYCVYYVQHKNPASFAKSRQGEMNAARTGTDNDDRMHQRSSTAASRGAGEKAMATRIGVKKMMASAHMNIYCTAPEARSIVALVGPAALTASSNSKLGGEHSSNASTSVNFFLRAASFRNTLT